MNPRKVVQISAWCFFAWLMLAFVLDGCVQFRHSSPVLQRYFAERGLHAQIDTLHTQGREVRYLSLNHTTAPPQGTLLFIHGAPSSMSYFRSYLADTALYRYAQLYAIDRPGYGYSGFGKPEVSIQKQAAAVYALMKRATHLPRPIVLVGTSYGTSVACRVAMDYPEWVDGLVLIAPALAPGEERIYDISYPLESVLVHWAVPRMIQSANAEKLAHEAELRQMLPHWGKIHQPVIYIQGEKDDLVYPTNARFARERLTAAARLEIIMVKNRGHLLAFSEHTLLTGAMRRMLRLAKATRSTRVSHVAR